MEPRHLSKAEKASRTQAASVSLNLFPSLPTAFLCGGRWLSSSNLRVYSTELQPFAETDSLERILKDFAWIR